MKYPTLQKVSLLTTVLVASLVLTAQAGPRTPKKITKIQRSMSSTASGDIRANLPIKRPADILYDQYDNAGANATSSQDFEVDLDPFDDFLADDFVVPGDQTWSIDSVDADGVYFNGAGPAINFNVFFYSDAGGFPVRWSIAESEWRMRRRAARSQSL